MALERDVEGVLEQYADLAAIGTIGDVVALTGENLPTFRPQRCLKRRTYPM